MSKVVRNITFAVMGIALLLSVQVVAAATSTRVTVNPFAKIAEDMLVTTKPSQLKPLITKLTKYCKELEIPNTDGCPDALTNLNATLKGMSSDPTAFELELNTFVDAVQELDRQYETEYGGNDREAAVEPTTPMDTLKADKERALENPFDQLVDWVKWWDMGSFYPKTVRSNAKLGAPMVNKLIENFCNKMELDFTDGCKDVMDIVKAKIKTNSSKPALNTSRREIIDTYTELLGGLSNSFESRYGGDARVNAVKPTPDGSTNPFDADMEMVVWWDLGSIFPDVVRTKYGPQMVKQINNECNKYSVYDRDGCPDEVGVLNDKLKRFQKKPSLNQTKENIVDAFKEVLTRLSEDYAGKSPDVPGASDVPDTTDIPTE